MIKVIFGKRGMGKSRQMCIWANERLEAAHGTVVFIDKDNDHMYDVNRDIRFINASEYGILGKDMLLGFLSGIAARDFDLEAVYVNSFAKLVCIPADELEPVMDFLEKFSAHTGADVTLAINDGGMPCPDFLRKYID